MLLLLVLLLLLLSLLLPLLGCWRGAGGGGGGDVGEREHDTDDAVRLVKLRSAPVAASAAWEQSHRRGERPLRSARDACSGLRVWAGRGRAWDRALGGLRAR